MEIAYAFRLRRGKKTVTVLDITLLARQSSDALVSSSAKWDQHLSQKVTVRMIKSDSKHSVMITIIII